MVIERAVGHKLFEFGKNILTFVKIKRPNSSGIDSLARIHMAEATGVGRRLLLDLPDDILVAIIGRSHSPRDVCNLSFCCRKLNSLAGIDKIWLTQCELLGFVSPADLVGWRKAVLSYKALCRFIFNVKSLLGIWVHQNPELGNVVYVMPGFVSVVGCRIIPQKVGSLGIEGSPIMWAPVFEVIGDEYGATSFILHGRDKDQDHIYPGSLKSVEKSCNVLLLEVEPLLDKNTANFLNENSFDSHTDESLGSEVSKIDSHATKTQQFVDQSSDKVPFSKLPIDNMKELLEIVTNGVRMHVSDPACSPLFPCLSHDEENFQKDVVYLSERLSVLKKLGKVGESCDDGDDCRRYLAERNPPPGDYVRDSIRQMLQKCSSINGSPGTDSDASLTEEFVHANLLDFLSSGDTIGLTLQACTMRVSLYRAWPIARDDLCALYKLPIQAPTVGQEYNGLWGGTFGWPPTKPGNALFLFVLSYYQESPGKEKKKKKKESPGKKFLTATKILEGAGYAHHPNGSAMFTVNVDKSLPEPFPFESSSGSLDVVVNRTFSGEGIASGYGFRYPGSKPGSLFVLEDGMLAFLWIESRTILTLQRLNLVDLLKRGKRVPALAPIDNFSYLTRSYTDVFGS